MMQDEIINLITAWKLNKLHLATMCKINPYTFKMKLARKPGYTFTDQELERIADVIGKLGRAASVFAGMK